MKIVWTRRALREIDQAFAFVAQDNPAAASALVQAIEARAAVLADHPDIGRPGRVDGTRELVLSGFPFILPYRVRDGRIEILAVFHTSRAWPDQL
ncbi:MAG: type II toxin-antitoxin system RelE/ParE family toxin [Bosea sp. (in: a-proteobacteria)]|uniref:type II toxin-antitoxin system RelE/ParE family toxin n=1 Tax=Bosea sp. (in: a-proteobacteria) TaxID=1871050 RepID=UPI002735FB55|nr:type II toxin-antitoxin system RelE/ParE family toxin [Bosea sp. (in: a-proteobacteria)]MDP3255565.1 type II toxin-antitoxin system RelE/ParE family toxin [Bosea sp. (in: a-proteobacteria)]MDP3317533.1 type II toxin-antitoxin system RelE/ParE family toxin [Bosea sp. (in: a-proteobacteria)]